MSGNTLNGKVAILSAALTTFGIWVVMCVAQADEPAVLKPIKAESAGPRYSSVAPAPDGEGHFIARTRHLLDLVRKNPTPDDDPWFRINGVQFWPASPISRGGLKLLDEEGGMFDPDQRDRVLKCGVPKDLPPDTQVVLLEAQGSP